MAQEINPVKILRTAIAGVSDREAEEIAALGVMHSYPPDSVLCREGAIEETFYVILKGRVEVTKFFDSRVQRVLNHLVPGDFFGEMALIHNAPRAATVTTTEETTVLEIRKEAFNTLLARSSTLALAMAREVSRRLRENDQIAIEDLRLKASELAQAYEQLAEMEFARNEFLTVVAHELRTPLTSASGFLQFIRQGKLQGEALDAALDTVARNLKTIIALINDILFLQEMDFILPEFLPTDIGEVLESVLKNSRGRAAQNRIEIDLHLSPDLPKTMADARSLERVFDALVDNAIKFSPDGGEVVIRVYSEGGWLCVEIEDHGVGIPVEALPRIFDRFFHLEQVANHLFSGVGLGLSIARQVIEQHGGRIDVESRLGEGSIFKVRLRASWNEVAPEMPVLFNRPIETDPSSSGM
jgi:signal transduction histidine kinase